VGGQRPDHGTKGAGGPTGTADHPTQVGRVDAHLEQVSPADRLGLHPHVVGVVHDPAHQVLERIGQHQAFVSDSSFGSDASPAAASSALVSWAVSSFSWAAWALRNSASASAASTASS